MYIRKQRLLTPGPTPLYPPALHAMMASDLHHRTEEFRNVYKSALAGLKQVYGAPGDVLCMAASGSGAMDASVSNLFSAGDKVIVCTAGKFGERWVEIVRAYGLDATVLEAPYGDVVTPDRLEAALKAEPATRGVFVQGSESSTGAQHDVEAMGKLVAATDAIFVVDAITGLGTMPLDIEGWGLDVVIGGSQKAFMIPPGLAFVSLTEKAWNHAKTATLPHYYFDFRKEKKNGDIGESTWTPATSLILALNEALKYVNSIGMANLVANAQLLAHATREASRELGLQLFSSRPGSAVTAIRPPAGMDSGVIVKGYKQKFAAVITGGQGSMKNELFRLAHLGYFDFPDLFSVIAELELILRANGYPVELGRGVAAVQRVYEQASATKTA